MVFFCNNCSSLVMPGMVMCPHCGYRFDGAEWTPLKTAPQAPVSTVSNDEAPYLPYEPREMQLDIIADIRNALNARRHIVLESGTGTGKTIVSLAGALEFIKKPENSGMKVIYITRTNSQSDQVMKELRAISTIHPVSGITLSGRNKSCLLLMERDDFYTLTPSALSTICSDKKQKTTQGRPGGCKYFYKVSDLADDVEGWCKRSFPRSEEFDAYCQNKGVCPYETRKAIMKRFDVIVAPYIHIVDPGIRASLFQNLGLEEKDIILVVDEAHNLTDYTRDMESFQIHSRLVASSFDEAHTFRNAMVCENLTLPDFIRVLRNVLKSLADRYLPMGTREHLLGGREFEEEVCKMLGKQTGELDEMVDAFYELAEKRADAIADSDNPSSPMMDMAENLMKWIRSPSDRYVKAVKVNDDGEYLSASCIDPSEFPAFLRRLNGSIHMSGTLQPLSQYVRVMGLPDNTIPRKYPSPFPKENRKTVYANDVTTLYSELNKSPAMYARLTKYIVDLCNAVHKNTMVFVTSYSLLRKLEPELSRRINRPLYWEVSGNPRRTMQNVNLFRKEEEGVFFCVMGGSVAEGIDFPGDELCFAIIVGIPYPPPSLESNAMSTMFDKRYGAGKGWEYVSMVPAVRKIRQAAGRLIRKEDDRGMTVILDRRAARNKKDLEAEESKDVVADARQFFYGK